MMHECKRLLNCSTAADGLLFPGARTSGLDDAAMRVLIVPRLATEQAGNGSEGDNDAGENDGQEDEEQQDDEGTGQEARDDDACVFLAGGGGAEGSHSKQMFTKSFSHRDDWLHRGRTLCDMDYYHYARFVDRVELPRAGDADQFLKKVGVWHHFDRHYALASTHVQVLRRFAKTVQNVGPQCKRSAVNEGEDNALYKAYYHSCVHCPGLDECANPLLYRSLLHPHIEDMDRYLALLQSTPGAERVTVRFLPAWRARRNEIEVLADRAALKREAAMRIGVPHDTTAFKGTPIPRDRRPAATEEHGFEVRLHQVLLLQLARQGLVCRVACYERVAGLFMEYLDIPRPWHEEQAHLSEWQAYSAREILFHLDQTVDARNMAQAQARARAADLAKDDVDDEDLPASTARVVVEDIGGAPADFDGDAPPDIEAEEKQEMRLPVAAVERVLARTAERDAAGRVGRPRDAHKDIWSVAQTFGGVLDGLQSPFLTRHLSNRRIGADLPEALAHQADVAERLRTCQEGEGLGEGDEGATDDGGAPAARLLTEEAARLLESIAPEARGRGPVAVAKALADAATLNADQLGAVALIAADMQKSWEEQGRPERMKPTGRILRMLLLGGGGCGKTRIVNLVLTALFAEFWGDRGVVKAAPSNKAARGILGKTLHAAAKLGGSALDVKSLSCAQKTRTALAHLWAPCGAVVIDEAPQGAAALYHALALRCTYGRLAAHNLDVADYAEPAGSFGAMPVVVECGDELQLPPVPPSAGLFAELEGASTVHRAGVDLFRQKDYVYRLATMKRFSDPTLVSILT